MVKILLCGYMASGKTTAARLLAKASGIAYKDLDEVIENQTGKTIADLFAEEGEIRFRKLEHDALKDLLESDESFILALGGGTPCYANNHEFLTRDGVVSVYLKTGIPELVKRLRADQNNRPLLKKLEEDELEDFIAKHLFERNYYYMQSKHVVITDGKTPEAVVNEIMSLF